MLWQVPLQRVVLFGALLVGGDRVGVDTDLVHARAGTGLMAYLPRYPARHRAVRFLAVWRLLPRPGRRIRVRDRSQQTPPRSLP